MFRLPLLFSGGGNGLDLFSIQAVVAQDHVLFHLHITQPAVAQSVLNGLLDVGGGGGDSLGLGLIARLGIGIGFSFAAAGDQGQGHGSAQAQSKRFLDVHCQSSKVV